MCDSGTFADGCTAFRLAEACRADNRAVFCIFSNGEATTTAAFAFTGIFIETTDSDTVNRTGGNLGVRADGDTVLCIYFSFTAYGNAVLFFDIAAFADSYALFSTVSDIAVVTNGRGAFGIIADLGDIADGNTHIRFRTNRRIAKAGIADSRAVFRLRFARNQAGFFEAARFRFSVEYVFRIHGDVVDILGSCFYSRFYGCFRSRSNSRVHLADCSRIGIVDAVGHMDDASCRAAAGAEGDDTVFIC